MEAKILKVLQDIAKERLQHGVPDEVVAKRIADAVGKPTKVKVISKKATKKKK